MNPTSFKQTQSCSHIHYSMASLLPLKLHFLPFPAVSPNTGIKNRASCIPYKPNLIKMRSTLSSAQEKTTSKVETRQYYHPKLYTVMEAAADRAEMHANVERQRDNWNHLFLSSVNSMNLTATLIVAVAEAADQLALPLHAFKVSSVILFAFSAAIMTVVNAIQPSQLAEEQRNASRLFRQLERSIRMELEIGATEEGDVEEAFARVLALDKAYPLPLLPGMIDKFPRSVEPAVWWPRLDHRREWPAVARGGRNGWSKELEEEMEVLLRIMKRKDEHQYLSVGKLALRTNRVLALSGPFFAASAAISSAFIGTPGLGTWPVLVGMVGGALATVTNAMEHGGQVGMVFELLRGGAGIYRQLEEEIESNLEEEDTEKRESGELLETKIALQLGRSPSELKSFAVSRHGSFQPEGGDGDEEEEEFAGRLI